MNTEAIFKVTVTDDKGNEIAAYVSASQKDLYVQMAASEYGPAKVEPVDPSEIDAETLEAIRGQQK